jgi:hypothetical protein
MAFTTPCFVRVDDAAERKKLIEWCNDVIGRTGDEDYMYGDVVLCIKDTTYCCCYEETEFVANDTTIDCGTDVELFRALAAMNDENDREQWFVVDDGFEEEMVCSKSEVDYDYILSCYDHRKATAEEIVEYFKKREE